MMEDRQPEFHQYYMEQQHHREGRDRIYGRERGNIQRFEERGNPLEATEEGRRKEEENTRQGHIQPQ